MATPRKPIQKERFLLWMLAGVFGFQIVLFSVGAIKCASIVNQDSSVTNVCPDLGRRYDQTFGVMIATILALLGASKPN